MRVSGEATEVTFRTDSDTLQLAKRVFAANQLEPEQAMQAFIRYVATFQALPFEPVTAPAKDVASPCAEAVGTAGFENGQYADLDQVVRELLD